MDIDLNLLRVFDTLMELRSVTRAADRLGLTQSAISHSLRRLRRTLDDPLFVRGAQGLDPTPRAEAMAANIHEGLRRLRGAIAPAHFEHVHARRRFTIAASAYFCSLLIPSLIERTRREAPGVSLRIVPMSEHLATSLDRGAIDLALGTFARVPGRFDTELLYEEEMVWVAGAGNILASMPFDIGHILTLPRVSIMPRAAPDTPDAILGDDSLTMVVAGGDGSGLDEGVIVYDSQTAMAIVASSDLVALVPRRIATRAQGATVVLGPAGGDVRLSIRMLWHARQREDRGLAWLRQHIQAAA
jgi:DNA-binding transcriptional LysR family regulator